ncbi:hypothetical protein P2318_22945 [Myxococcaceae bacterium GXIMD 01537]
MMGWRWVARGWRGLLAAVLLGAPAWAAQESEPSAQTATESSGEEEEPPEVADAQVTGTDPAASEPPPAIPTDPAKKPGKQPPGKKPDSIGEGEEPNEGQPNPGKPRVRVFGRVFARASADERDDYTRTLRIPSARVGVGASYRNLEAEVTADLTSKNLLKDAFVRLSSESKRFRLYGGQFKAPFMERELESTWRLPLMQRGLVNDYLVETNELGGRRFGLMGEMRLKERWDLRVSAGLFQGGTDAAGERLSEDASARVSVRPFKALTVGASTYLGEVLQGTRRHAVAADVSLALGALGFTGELITGQLPLGPFNAQLALVAYTLRLGPTSDWAVQPLAGAESLRLRGEVAGQGWSAVGGVNILYTDSFKAQFQVERALRPGDAEPGLEFLLQLATRF